MPIVLVAWVGDRTAMQCSVRSLSLSTVPYSMKNLIACFQVILCLKIGIRFTAVLQYSTRNRNAIFSALNFIVMSFNVPRTNFSIKQLRGENRELYRTGPDQLYPKAFVLRPNRVLLVLAIFKRAMDEKMLALRLRTSAT